jgi:hypothetical protein
MGSRVPTILLLIGFNVTGLPAQDGAEFFETNIRPLFARQCMACHSASAGMGGLKLDTRENLLKGGKRGPAVTPGKVDESILIRAVSQSADLKMPPSGKLKDSEIALLRQWVGMNAPWGAEKSAQSAGPQKKFWAFIPPKEPAVPMVKNRGWVKSPIDAFVLAGLEAKGLAPAPAADKRTLLRRATFDLTGLPPSPEEVQAFLKDDQPGAFGRVVDRLLASPHYGERWGRHWLDVARYADSNGLDENLVYRHAFRYRDYVIAAFNKDKPYDLFVKEQLAGDLLPASDEATQFERWTATGFLSLGAKMLAEDDPLKMEMDIVDEQLDTTSRAFMGMTVGCARCHDHKFDPIPTADYYSMAGIFKSSKTMENFKVVAKWHEYVLANEPARNDLNQHLAKIEVKTKEIGRLSGVENAKLAKVARAKTGAYLLAATDVLRFEKTHLAPAAAGAGITRAAGSFDRGNAPRTLEKGKTNIAAGVKGPYFAEFDVTAPAAGDYQLDMLEEESGAGSVDVLVNGTLEMKGKPPVTNREASPDAGGWSVSGVFPLAAGKNTIRFEHKNRFPYFESLHLTQLATGVEAPRSSEQLARKYGVNPGYLKQWAEEMRRDKGAPNSVLFALFAYSSKSTLDAWLSPAKQRFAGFAPKTREELAARYQQLFDEAEAATPEALKDPALAAFREFSHAKAGPFRAPGDAKQYYPAAVQEQIASLEKEKKTLEDTTPDLPKAMGISEGDKIADIPIHIRGSHWTLGKEAPRHFLTAISSESQPAIPANQSGRLQLAEWLANPGHPLTSRVMANRIWRWHFGKGIVPSMDNFGRLGELPTNQPLLDWLALRFTGANWSIKEMHRIVMLSNTYQMSSNYDAKAAEADPENTLLWRANRQRLESEEVRDAVTAVTGEIDLSVGGTLLNYKDRQYVANTSRRGGTDYDNPRRAVYIPVVRSSLYEMFQAFDLPDPATPNGDRSATVIAPQALFMMNSTLVLKSTRAMAGRLLDRKDLDDAARIRDAYERALARPPAARDIDRALTFIAHVEKALEPHEQDPAKRHLEAWQSFCKALLASNEFIYLN